MKKSHKKEFLLIVIFVFFISSIFILNTQLKSREVVSNDANLLANTTKTYVPLVSDFGSGVNFKTDSDLASTLDFLYKFGISTAVVLSIFMIMFSGVNYMITDSMSGKKEGKKILTGAVVGLLIALSSWILLNTINPDILKKNNSILFKE